MPWINSNTGAGTHFLPQASGSGRESNQLAVKITLPVEGSITELRVIAAGYYNNDATARVVIWNVNGDMLQQSETFSLGRYPTVFPTYNIPITPIILEAGDYWFGLYGDLSKDFIMFGYTVGTPGDDWEDEGYGKNNSTTFPAVTSMEGATDIDFEPYTAIFYIGTPAPVDTAVVTRVSDTQQNLTWNNNATTDAPYDAVYVERYDNVTDAYYLKATLASTATSYSDTTTTANKLYRYRIRAGNAYAYSDYDVTNDINTTPAAPTSVVATRVSGSIELTWIDNATNEDLYELARRESLDAGDTWEAWDYATLPDQAAEATSYTDVAPYDYGQYKVRAKETDDTLYSAWVESNEYVLITPPNAPTGLAPDALTLDANNNYTFAWNHNDIDGTAQTKFSLQYRLVGGSFSATPLYDEEVSVTESVLVPASTFTNGNDYEWQVKTWGEHVDASSYSNIATFTATTVAVGTITDPTTITDYGYSELTVEWTYTQAESNSQAQYLCKLYDENDLLIESKQVSSVVATGATDSCTFTYSLSNETDYKVTLQVQESDGLWSAETEVEFTSGFLEPMTPTITLNLARETGSINITIANPAVVVDYVNTATQASNVSANSPNDNFNGSGELLLTNDTAGGTQIITALLDFDLSFFVGKTIVSADLTLYRKTTLVAGIESKVNYINSAWDEATVTYASTPTYDATDYDDHAHTTTGVPDTEIWDLTTFMDDIADGTITDYEGIAIIASTTDGSVDTFYDNTNEYKPTLIVEISPLNATTDYNKIYRSMNSGEWVLIQSDISTNTTITDYLPTVGGNNNYYCQAVSLTPSIKNSAEVDLDAVLTGMFFINGGSGFEDVVRLVGDVSLSEERNRSQTYKQYAGRTYPIKYQGNYKTQNLSFSADCPITKYDDLVDIIEYVGNTFYRDWRGRWFYCMLDGSSFNKKDNLAYQYDTTVIRIEDET